MNKKIIAIGIVALFLLTGFSVVSAGTVKQTENVIKAAEPTGTSWTRPMADVILGYVDNLQIRDKNGPLDKDNLNKKIYFGVVITGTQIETNPLYGSMAFASPGWVRYLILVSIADILGNIYPNKDPEAIMLDLLKNNSGVHLFETGQFTITMDVMTRGIGGPSDGEMIFRGWNIEVAQP